MVTGDKTDEVTVLELDDRERLAALQRDVAALDLLWSEQFTVNAPNSAVVQGKRAVMETFVTSGIIDFSSFERRIEFVRIDGNFAFLMGLESLVPNSDAPSTGHVAGQVIKRRFTNIWKKEEDGATWRLFARHANVIPNR